MNKEYEEAQVALMFIVRKAIQWGKLTQHRIARDLPTPEDDAEVAGEYIDQILSLKGENWRIALVKNDMSGVGKPNFKHVIWEGE